MVNVSIPKKKCMKDNVFEMQNFFFSHYPNTYERDRIFVIIKW